MTLSNRARFLAIGGISLGLIAGGGTAAFAGTNGGGGHPRDKDAPHCVWVDVSGSTQSGYGKNAETYSASASVLVCESKDGQVFIVKAKDAQASETEAGHHHK
jgi:hypothetical protein